LKRQWMYAVPELVPKCRTAPKTPKTQRTNERGKPLIPHRILAFQMVPGGGIGTPMELLPTDFESAFSTVAGARKQTHVDRITSYTSATCKGQCVSHGVAGRSIEHRGKVSPEVSLKPADFRSALDPESTETSRDRPKKYHRKAQRTCVPTSKIWGYFRILLLRHTWLRPSDFWSAGSSKLMPFVAGFMKLTTAASQIILSRMTLCPIRRLRFEECSS
jgi:hypothetical protein